MAISDTSRGRVGYIEEVTPGVTPASALQDLRFTGESISNGFTNETSSEIRSDRQITDSILVGSEPAGDINFELSFATYDDFLEGALFSDWSTAVAISATDLSAANADNSYNSTSTDFTAENLNVGQWIKVAGFTDSSNNGYCRVVSIAATKLVVSGLTLADEAAGDTVTMSGQFLSNGTTEHYYTIEKQFTDLSPVEFLPFKGMKVSGLSLSIASNSILTGSFSFMGLTAGASANATAGSGSYTASNTNDVYNASSNIGNIRENGVALGSTTYVTGLDLSLDNGLRSQKAIGNLGPVGIGDGRCNVTGTLTSFFSSADLYDKLANNTATSLDFRVTDSSGNVYVIDLPRIKLQAGSVDISAADADVEFPADFQALRDPTLGFTMSISKIPA